MVIQYIGRTTSFKGKPLWEILGNLQNFGVGRLVYRNMFQRYPEPCYMRILKVQAEPLVTDGPPDTIRKVIVLVERVFRGIKSPRPIQLDSTTYKADYVLIPRDEEHKFLENKLVHTPSDTLPMTLPLPPLFREFIKVHEKYGKLSYPKAKCEELLQVPVAYSTCRKDKYKIAKEDQEATITFSTNMGKLISPKFLYDNAKTEETEENVS